MKKYFVIALAAMSMTFVSCKKKTVEEQAQAYVEQLMEAEKAGDAEKSAKIQKEMEEWAKGLSQEDQMKAGMIMLKAMAPAMEEASAAIDEATEELSDVAEEAADAVEEAAEEATEAVEEAAE